MIDLSSKEKLKKAKMMLQIKREIKKAKRKLKYVDSSLDNKKLIKKLEIKKSNYEKLTRG